MATAAVTDASFETDVLGAAEPVVVDFWAEWCGPCKMIAPHLESIATEMNGRVKIVKINVDENQRTAAKYGVRSIPTLIMFKNGEAVDMKVGAGPKSDLQKWIEKTTG
ncbi:thioredoxin [Faunimonas sp. B44]|uniref:thioredoxin n=1 Tax=Faunimonas sp. B44 TaxID=3461493 RepID=UPI004043C575